ncbi:MAG: hypothetical protein JWQ92_308 [Amnibacterium sp.]|nr:hypothetical protein [Amnibacterium sp.]
MLIGWRPAVLALRAVVIVACVGLYTAGFLTVLKIAWLGLVLLGLAALITVPANALLRAQIQTLPPADADG